MRDDIRNLDALTSLRFFAAISVLFYHSGSSFARSASGMPGVLVNMLGHGWLGVPFFFILSGFILAHVYAGKGLTPRSSRPFFAARFARIYPVYLLSLLLMAPFGPPMDWSRDWQQFLMVQSWPVDGDARQWNLPAWSLSVEASFYLAFPIVLPLLDRLPSGRIAVLFAANGLLLLAIWLNMGIPGAGVPPHELLQQTPLPLLRLPEFLNGLLLGLLFRNHGGSVPRPALYAVIAAILLAAALPRSFFSHVIAILAFGPLIFLIAANGERGWAGRLLNNRLLVFLGGASYAIYLLQVPVLYALQAMLPAGQDTLRRAIYAPLLVTVAAATFAWFEDPARRALRRFCKLPSAERSVPLPPSRPSVA